ncbi:hypothetical protein [Azohydromonas lata]|uniref:BACON domain-containing protein n=1 Tax=Azohydromonas lata TaxID=45677 RepID=A0ABU5ID03_9BURK|nr:hypothetical protein [Azohydromonas lata]MDZ5457003.1 hypothetical protein [Azohydromonas lata]
MSLGDWGASEGHQRMAASGALTTMIAPGSLNTKGAWTQIVASTAFDAAALLLTLSVGTTNGSVLVDIGIGAAGTETVLLGNLQARRISSGNNVVQLLLPLQIPAGSRIALRYQQTAANVVLGACASVVAATWNSPATAGRTATHGAVPASSSGTVVDPGASANTKGAWVELTPATDSDASWLLLSVMPTGTAINANTAFYVDVAVGASGAEQIIVPDVPVYVAATVESSMARVLLPISIPAGSRLAVRMQCSATTTPGREREVVAHLIG